MTEGILGAGIGQELAVGVVHAFGHHDHAVANSVTHCLTLREEMLLVEGDLGEQDDVRRLGRALARQTARGGDPARMAAHHLHHEHLGRGLGHRGDVERGLAHRDRDVLGDRAEARAAVGVRQVVVDGLRHADADERMAELIADLGHLVSAVSIESLPPL